MNNYPLVWVMMGVAGSGKTVVGRRWATRLDCDFLEGDRRHSPANIAKMSGGIPLNDGDRQQWLLNIKTDMKRAIEQQREIVMTCAALKAAYRTEMAALGRVQFVWLQVSPTELKRRLAQRSNHYMQPDMLNSQLDAFEGIAPSENILTLDSGPSPDQMVEHLWIKAVEQYPELAQAWWQRSFHGMP